MSNVFGQLKSLGEFSVEAAKEVVSTGEFIASLEEATRRFNICVSCPFLVKSTNVLGVNKTMRCIKCGCQMANKVRLKAAKCADKENPKW